MRKSNGLRSTTNNTANHIIFSLPVYSGMEAGDDIVDAFSQSPFCAAKRPGDSSLDGE